MLNACLLRAAEPLGQETAQADPSVHTAAKAKSGRFLRNSGIPESQYWFLNLAVRPSRDKQLCF